MFARRSESMPKLSTNQPHVRQGANNEPTSAYGSYVSGGALILSDDINLNQEHKSVMRG
jgi:hypothetical protein